MIVIDASGHILGRLSTNVAKRILNGEDVIVVNAEKAIISGKQKMIKERFQKRLQTRTLGSQKKAPKHPRTPENYLRRAVRGMLPWKAPKGKRAYRRLKVYVGVPDNLKDAPKEIISKAKKDVEYYTTVGRLLEIYGWRNHSIKLKPET